MFLLNWLTIYNKEQVSLETLLKGDFKSKQVQILWHIVYTSGGGLLSQNTLKLAKKLTVSWNASTRDY